MPGVHFLTSVAEVAEDDFSWACGYTLLAAPLSSAPLCFGIKDSSFMSCKGSRLHIAGCAFVIGTTIYWYQRQFFHELQVTGCTGL